MKKKKRITKSTPVPNGAGGVHVTVYEPARMQAITDLSKAVLKIAEALAEPLSVTIRDCDIHAANGVGIKFDSL